MVFGVKRPHLGFLRFETISVASTGAPLPWRVPKCCEGDPGCLLSAGGGCTCVFRILRAVCFCGSWCAGTYSSIGPGRFSLVAAASSRLLLTLWWPHHPPGESPCSRPHARDQEGMTRGSLRCVSCTPTHALTAPAPGPPGPISLFQSPSAGAGGRRRNRGQHWI